MAMSPLAPFLPPYPNLWGCQLGELNGSTCEKRTGNTCIQQGAAKPDT